MEGKSGPSVAASDSPPPRQGPRRLTEDEIVPKKDPTVVEYTPKTGIANTRQLVQTPQEKQRARLSLQLTGGKPKSRANKVFSNKVYVPWYRRYCDLLPNEEERIQTQPYFELYSDSGGKGKEKKNQKSSTKARIGPKRDSVQEKEIEIAKKRLRAIHTREKAILAPITNYLAWVRRKRMKQRKDYEMYRGRWLKFFTPDAKAKLKILSRTMKKKIARQRFIKVANAVICLNTFLSCLKESHYSSDLTLGEISAHAETQAPVTVKHGLFDPHKYKVINKMDESATIPFKVKLILTKPWYTRTVAEVDQVVEALYSLFIFVRYPTNVARQLARVAWYSRLGKQRPILRQSDEAQCFCFLLSGLVKLFCMTHDSQGRQVEVVYGRINRGHLFGAEDMTQLHAVRKMSVTTIVSSELMTIDFHDYQASLLSPLGAVRIPNHIKIIKKNTYIKKVALIDILDSALECLPTMYFPPNSIISESMRECDFTFLVLQGECYSAALPLTKPKPEDIQLVQDKHDFSATFLQIGGQQNYEDIRKSMRLKSDNNNETVRRDRILVNLMKTKGEFEADIIRLCEVSLVRPKEELIREVRPRRILGYYTGPNTVAYERSVAEDIVKKMRMYEESNEEYKDEIRRMRRKSEKVNKVLERLAKTEESRTNRKVIFDERMSKDIYGVDSELADLNPVADEAGEDETTDKVKGILRESRYDDEDNGDTNGHVKAIAGQQKYSLHTKSSSHVRFGENDQSAKRSVDRMSSGGQLAGVRGSKFSDEGRRSTSTISLPKISTSIVERDDSDDAFSMTDPRKSRSFLVELKLKKTEEDEAKALSHDSNVQTDNAGEAKVKRKGVKKREAKSGKGKRTKELSTTASSTTASSSDSHESFDEARSDKNSLRYKKVHVHRKNQIIGDQYVDYNDGKFREQERDVGLVSGGVEVIMIAKWFLLQHMFHNW